MHKESDNQGTDHPLEGYRLSIWHKIKQHNWRSCGCTKYLTEELKCTDTLSS